MKRSAVAAVALVGASALTGSAVVPGSASSVAPEMHTKRLVLGQTQERNVGKFSFVGSDIVKSRASGKVVGFDSITGKFYPKKEKFVVQIALALKGGIIVGRVSGKGEAREFDGRILKGSGKYSGVEGTIQGRFANESRVHLTLHYHL
jgi:hypothetical protein